MYIEELKEEEVGGCEREEQKLCVDLSRGTIVVSDAKRVLVGAGARALFYPTLLCNVLRNKVQSEFHWWDRVDQFVLLGAVPFPADVPCLKELGVCGVVTLNEPYETLVPTSLYHAHDIDHLVIPTRDYLFAPSYGDTCQAVNFIHEKASCGKTTYVHCKAGRGRSTTIVLCYLVEYKQMTPDSAYEYVRSIRPRVLLASSQWQAVQDFYLYRTKKTLVSNVCTDIAAFDDASVVVVTESDLDGYDSNHDLSVVGNNMLAELSLGCRVQFASQAAIARLSCLWLRRNEGDKMSREKLGSSVGPDQLGRAGVDIRVY